MRGRYAVLSMPAWQQKSLIRHVPSWLATMCRAMNGDYIWRKKLVQDWMGKVSGVGMMGEKTNGLKWSTLILKAKIF
jgi:hypothetical protein